MGVQEDARVVIYSLDAFLTALSHSLLLPRTTTAERYLVGVKRGSGAAQIAARLADLTPS